MDQFLEPEEENNAQQNLEKTFMVFLFVSAIFTALSLLRNDFVSAILIFSVFINSLLRMNE